MAHREGLVTNPKRTRRIWRDEGRPRPRQRKAKRRRLADGAAARLRARCPNDVWALDFPFDDTAELRRIKLLNIVDELSREAWRSKQSTASTPTASSTPSSASSPNGGEPANLRMDNGPELVSAALRDIAHLGHPHRLHRVQLALGEPLHRVLQRAPARRVSQCSHRCRILRTGTRCEPVRQPAG